MIVVAIGTCDGAPVYAVGPFDSYDAGKEWISTVPPVENWRWDTAAVVRPETAEQHDPYLSREKRPGSPENGGESRTEVVTPEVLVARVRESADDGAENARAIARHASNDAAAVNAALGSLRAELRAGSLEIADGLRDLARSVEASRRGE